MKAIILFFCLVISVNTFSQKIDYKDLIGTSWTYIGMPKLDSISFVFLDSSNYQFFYWKAGKNRFDGTVMNYSLDTSYAPTLWFWGSYTREDDGKKVDIDGIYCFIKFIDKNTLEAQSRINGTKPRKKFPKKNGGHLWKLIRTSENVN